jgi:predicted DNA-binding transcriptional regulator AlpA
MPKSPRGTSPSRKFPKTRPPVPVEPVTVATGPVRVLSKTDVMEKLGIRSYLTLRSWVINNGFPAPRELGPGNGRSLVGWLSSEVDAWLANRPLRLPKGASR